MAFNHKDELIERGDILASKLETMMAEARAWVELWEQERLKRIAQQENRSES